MGGSKKKSLVNTSPLADYPQSYNFVPLTPEQQLKLKEMKLGWGSVGTRDRSKSNRSRWQSWNEDQEIINSRNYDSRFSNDVQEYDDILTIRDSDIPFNNYQDDIHQLMTGYYHRY